MKNTLILLFLAIFINIINAQVLVGYVNDMDGISFNGYYDALDYSPNKGLSVSYFNAHLNFTEAYYYDKAGVKKEGFIKLHHKKIFFKTTDLDKKVKINASEIQSCVVGKDSFISIKGNDNKYKIVKYLATYNDHTFIITNNTSALYPEKINYIKSKKSNKWWRVDSDSIFYLKVKPLFATIPAIKDKIDSYRLKDLPMLLKVAKYNEKYLEKKPIYFDKNWQELKNKHKARYTAKITIIHDSIWTFEYYDNAIKLYKASYSSFNPAIKNGNFVAYYPNEQIRKIVRYENDKPIRVKLYNDSGMQTAQFNYVTQKKGRQTEQFIKYNYVNDSLGNNILKSNDIYSDIVIDKYNRASYHRVFKNKQLLSKYRLSGKDTIFQITDLNLKYKKLEKLQLRLNDYVLENEFGKSIIDDVQGVSLLYFLIDTKGNVIKGKLLNHLDPKIDIFMESFVDDMVMDESVFGTKFKPMKKGNKNQYWEFVLPVLFRIGDHDLSIRFN